MLSRELADRYNARLMDRLSLFLNLRPDGITGEEVQALSSSCDVSEEYAWSALLACELGLDTENDPDDRRLFEAYFPQMVKKLNAAEYEADPYYANIRIPEKKLGRWELCTERYKPYEAFVTDDLMALDDGRILPQIGFFDREFAYPAVLEDGREWMLVTPEEINTMRPAEKKSRGRVLTYGLGLGCFAHMAASKAEVASVTVVERDPAVIELFTSYILPQFIERDKIDIVCADAFEYAENRMGAGNFDLVFTDIWHDPSDGVELYLKMKQYERFSPRSEFVYWIEPTLKCYL